MILQGDAREVADSYRETLSKLTFNNKLVINTLTEIANENKNFAREIVTVIDDRVKQVRVGFSSPKRAFFEENKADFHL